MSQYSEIVCDLLQGRSAEPSATEMFTRWKHDADLCPKFQQKVEAIFSAFEKYHIVSYEIQGLKDEGTDLLLRERVDDQNEFVCFQIKGEWDLSQKDFLKTLKAQYFDSRKRYEPALKDYYIVVCYSIVTKDQVRRRVVIDETRKQKVKAIMREFSLETKVRVIEPEFAAWFLQLSAIQIDAIIKSRFGDEDIVFKEAIDLVSDLGVTEKIILVFVLWQQLYHNKLTVTVDEITQSPFIQRIHQMLADEANYPIYEFDDQIAHDLETLEDKFIECDSTGGFSLPVQSVQPLAILMMDGNVRYDYQDDELLEYMLRILGAFDLPSSE